MTIHWKSIQKHKHRWYDENRIKTDTTDHTLNHECQLYIHQHWPYTDQCCTSVRQQKVLKITITRIKTCLLLKQIYKFTLIYIGVDNNNAEFNVILPFIETAIPVPFPKPPLQHISTKWFYTTQSFIKLLLLKSCFILQILLSPSLLGKVDIIKSIPRWPPAFKRKGTAYVIN